MNKIINKYWQIYEELDSKQPGFTYSAFGAITKHRERIKKFRETGNLKNIYIEMN